MEIIIPQDLKQIVNYCAVVNEKQSEENHTGIEDSDSKLSAKFKEIL